MPRRTRGFPAPRVALVAIALGLALPFPAHAAAAPRPIRLLSSNESGVTFDVAVPEPRLTSIEAKNNRYQRLDLDGFVWDAGAGEPLLPATGVLIAVPLGARVTVEATGEGARLFESVRILPQQVTPERISKPGAVNAYDRSSPAMRPAPGLQQSTAPSGPLDVELIEDVAAYARSGLESLPLASVEGVTFLREQRVARIVVRPASFDPAARRLRVWSAVRVHVHFESDAAATGTLGRAVGVPESGPFEGIYRGAILNHESGRAWRSDLQANSLKRRGLVPNARPGIAGTPGGGAREDFTASPNWLRIAVPSKGVYRIDAADLTLAGVSLAGVDPSTVRLFVKPGVPLLGELDPPAGWLSEVAINVVGEGDGRFDAADYILFYGLGASGWRDDFTSPGASNEWLNHPYDTKNTYWLTWGGGFSSPVRRWNTRDVAPDDPTAYTTPDFPARIHFEQDNDYFPSLQEGFGLHALSPVFWDKWMWFNVADIHGTIPFTFNLPGVVTTRPARIFARMWGNSLEVDTDRLVFIDHFLNVGVNEVTFAQRRFNGYFRQDYDSTFTDVRETGNRMTVRCSLVTDLRNPNRRDQVAVNFFDVRFRRFLRPVNNTLEFRSADTTGTEVAYGLGPFTSTAGVLLVDTSDPLDPVVLTGAVERDTTGGKALYFQDGTPVGRNYLVVTAANLRRPDSIARAVIDDLESPANGADYVVITHDGFATQARTLADHRARRLPGVPNPRTRVVKMSDIYAWYSGGRTDPTAIRNFVYDAVKNAGWSPAPSYVCLFGDASYDFKNIFRLASPGQPPSLVPSYQNGYHTRQFMMDDWLVDLDLGLREAHPNGIPGDSLTYDLPDLMIGRVPANTVDEANVIVQSKIIPYEDSPELGEWRMRGLLIADDLLQGFEIDPLSDTHIWQSERIANETTPPLIEQRKVYLVRYPYGSGSEKPGANRDVKDAVNEGVVFWNYIGHGNPIKMADENAFILSDVGSLANLTRPSFVIAASCDLGKFDDPVTEGLGESLLKAPAGGAIATFSASDIAFATSNFELSRELFLTAFEESTTGFSHTLGEACYLAKRRESLLSVNDLKYILMGDPALQLALPRAQVRLTLADADTDAPVDSLRRGQRIRIRGEVHQSHDPGVNVVDAAFQGTVALLVTDSPPSDSVQGFFDAHYTYDPGTIFRGDAQVVNGRFDQAFVMPLEALVGAGGRVQAYVQNGQSDGGGVRVQGVTTGVPLYPDSTGPTIGLSFLNGKIEVPPNAVLRVVARDESGINLTGHTIPNGLFLTVDNTARFDLTKDFRYDAGSYQQGTIEFTLPNLPPGPHSIEVSVADNYAQGVLGRKNRSTATIYFEVVGGTAGAFDLGRVYNFPNPFKTNSGTSFVLTGLTEPARVLVKIYSVSGSLVRALESESSAGQAQLFWDGTDTYGDQVANGAYTYLVEAQGSTSGTVLRYRGRAAVLN